jgi:hypothetical protein
MIGLFLILVVCFGDILDMEKKQVRLQMKVLMLQDMHLVQLGLCSNLEKHLTLRV